MAQDYIRTMPFDVGDSRRRLQDLHLDPLLLFALLAVLAFGLIVLYSAAHGDTDVLGNQLVRIGIAGGVMLIAAQLQPHFYRRWAWVIYGVGLALLVVVLFLGDTAKGAQRWLDLPGLPRFQPSELMKLAVPLAIASYFHERPLPPNWLELGVAFALFAVPAGLIAMQPDLGTGIMVAGGGLAVVLLSGIRWRLVAGLATLAAMAAPVLWFVMRDYQKARVLTLLDPESDPLGAGWNIIQSKIALGSGGSPARA